MLSAVPAFIERAQLLLTMFSGCRRQQIWLLSGAPVSWWKVMRIVSLVATDATEHAVALVA